MRQDIKIIPITKQGKKKYHQRSSNNTFLHQQEPNERRYSFSQRIKKEISKIGAYRRMFVQSYGGCKEGTIQVRLSDQKNWCRHVLPITTRIETKKGEPMVRPSSWITEGF